MVRDAGQTGRIGAMARPLAAALSLVLVSLAQGGPAGAVDDHPITVDPTTVSNHTPFTVSGAGCIDPQTQTADGLKVFVVAEHLYYSNPDNIAGTLYAITSLAPDGSWSVTTAPNTREEYFGPFDDFDTTVTAYCSQADDPSAIVFQYDTVTIHYLGARGSTATTLPPSTIPLAPTTTAGPTTSDDPAPAAPVSGSATFTG